MAAWAGFSEDELRRIQQKGDAYDAVRASLGRGRRSAPTNRSRQQLQREKALQLAAKQKESGASTLSPDQQLRSPQPPAPSHVHPGTESKQEPKAPEPPEPEHSKQNPDPPQPEPSALLKELDTQQVELREKTRLQQLQWEQQMMEEKNKRRKALLAKTIAEKSKQTQAEARKLQKVQKELQALDDSVSNDIGILRKLIEQASLEYSVAWKRLEKAEAEFVSAKLELHRKTEVKEQLTEHLCAIIQQNEARKARKLDELMMQLELSNQEEEEEEEAAEPAHSHAPTLQDAQEGGGEVKGNSSQSDGALSTPIPDQQRASPAQGSESAANPQPHTPTGLIAETSMT